MLKSEKHTHTLDRTYLQISTFTHIALSISQVTTSFLKNIGQRGQKSTIHTVLYCKCSQPFIKHVCIDTQYQVIPLGSLLHKIGQRVKDQLQKPRNSHTQNISPVKTYTITLSLSHAHVNLSF